MVLTHTQGLGADLGLPGQHHRGLSGGRVSVGEVGGRLPGRDLLWPPIGPLGAPLPLQVNRWLVRKGVQQVKGKKVKGKEGKGEVRGGESR